MNGTVSLPRTLFQVIVPVVATMTEMEMEFVGLVNEVQNGEETGPNQLAMTRVQLPLDRLIDIYANGFTIKLVNKHDVPVIYHMLENYIKGYDPNIQYTSLNQEIKVDDRINTIKQFMISIMEFNKNSIIRYNIGTARSGFDLGINTIKHAKPVEVVKRETNVINSRAMGVRASNSMYNNNVPVIDFDMVEYKKRMKYASVYRKDQ